MTAKNSQIWIYKASFFRILRAGCPSPPVSRSVKFAWQQLSRELVRCKLAASHSWSLNCNSDIKLTLSYLFTLSPQHHSYMSVIGPTMTRSPTINSNIEYDLWIWNQRSYSSPSPPSTRWTQARGGRMASLTSPCPTAHADAALKTRCDTNVAEHHSKVCGLSEARSVNMFFYSWIGSLSINEMHPVQKQTKRADRVQNATAPVNVELYVCVWMHNCTLASRMTRHYTSSLLRNMQQNTLYSRVPQKNTFENVRLLRTYVVLWFTMSSAVPLLS